MFEFIVKVILEEPNGKAFSRVVQKISGFKIWNFECEIRCYLTGYLCLRANLTAGSLCMNARVYIPMYVLHTITLDRPTDRPSTDHSLDTILGTFTSQETSHEYTADLL